MARVALAAPARIVDLGCGAGNVTRILAERWPRARIVGVDNSEAMLAEARAATGGGSIAWQAADLAAWARETPAASIDLVYSNAALHWLDDHATLFPRLMGTVAHGGALAVQMPSNFSAPSHMALHDVANAPRWRARLAGLLRAEPVAPAAQYFDWLSPHADQVDIWTTEYLHVLPPAKDTDHPVVAWMKGTALTPFFAALDGEAQREFVRDCAERVMSAYPTRADGRVLYPFRRLFIVAARGNR